MKVAREKGVHEMTMPELNAAIEHLCGLPCPPVGSPRELYAEHEVAANFLAFVRDAENAEQAKRAAAEWTMQNNVFPLEELTPHIERAMGRKLLPAEVADRTLYD
jgi:hypothetical protein